MADEHSSDKQIIVSGTVWTLPSDSDAGDVFKAIEAAFENGTVARVSVLDERRRRVDILINTRVVGTVVLDANVDPRPSETSG